MEAGADGQDNASPAGDNPSCHLAHVRMSLSS